jgi:thioredoxin 1
MASENVLSINADNFESEVKNSDKPVLVDFWAEWCGPCKMLGPVLDELADEKGDAVKIGKVNVDENQELSAEYGVKSIPLLLFFKDGEVKDQIVGVASKDAIAAKLDALV